MSALAIQVKDLRHQLDIKAEEHAAELSAKETKIEELTALVDEHTGQVTALSEQLETVKAELETEEEKLEELTSEVTAKDERIAELEEEIAKAKAALEDPAFANAGGGEGVEGESQSSEAPVSWEALKSLTGSEKVAYWQAHKSELLK